MSKDTTTSIVENDSIELQKQLKSLETISYKPIFEKQDIHKIFYNGCISEENKDYSFNIDFVVDDEGVWWHKQKTQYTKLKYTREDGDINPEIINTFKSYFNDDNPDFISGGVIRDILRAYSQFGRKEYKKLMKVPRSSVVFNNTLIYFGDDIERDINFDKLPLDIMTKDIFIEEIKKTGCIKNPMRFFFVKNAIPYDYKTKSIDKYKFPFIKNLLKEWLTPFERWDNPNEIDLKNIETDCEIIGYGFLPNFPEPKTILKTGQGANGKSQDTELSEVIIGVKNVTATTLEALKKDDFEVYTLKDKTLCLINETSNGFLPADVLKRLTGDDLSRGRPMRKHKIEFRNYAKPVIITNNTPKTNDFTDGNMRRFIFLDFVNDFDKIPNHKKVSRIIDKIPKKEFLEFANYCLCKLIELAKRDFKFSNELTTAEKRQRFKEKTADLDEFLDKFTMPKEDGLIIKLNFKDKFASWYSRNHDNAKMQGKVWTTILRKLTDIGYNPSTADREYIDGKQFRCFKGIAWLKENTITEYLEPKEVASNQELVLNKTKEYSKQEIYDLYVSLGKIDKHNYDVETAIKILTKQNIIRQTKDGIFKIN